MAEHYTQVGGVRLHWVSQGEGEPVVFIHGFASDLHTWDPNVGRIGPVSAIAVDLPGHGLSDKPVAFYTASYYARLLRRFLAESGIGPATLVGLSLGGLIAARLALDFPDWVRRLVLVDAAGVGSRPQGWASRRQFLPLIYCQAIGRPSRETTAEFLRCAVLGDGGLLSDGLVEACLRAQMQCRVASVITSLTLLLPDARVYSRLHRIQAPTLVVWGEKDRTFALADGRDAGAAIAGARLVTIPGAGHAPNREAPALFNEALREFLAGG